jgi:cytochrome o ubiquinol oxidase subunit 2
MAGMVTRLHFRANHPGKYRGMSANFSGKGFADMHFIVDAVAPEGFEQLVASARGDGPTLDASSYAELVKPGGAVAPFTYGAVAPNIFGLALNVGMQTDDERYASYPVCVRQDR